MLLPPLSPSSYLNKVNCVSSKSFNFQFSIHSSSGALLLTPENNDGFLQFVKNVEHREPEDHLKTISDLIVDALTSCQRQNSYLSIKGCTDKDVTLAECMKEKLNTTTGLIFPPGLHPLEAQNLICNASTQPLCDPGTILIVRHLLEHTLNLDLFLVGLRQIIGDQSLCYIEVPDSAGLFINGDLTQLWEEHSIYFTVSSFHAVLASNGFKILTHQQIVSEGEPLCCAVVRSTDQVVGRPVPMKDQMIVSNFLYLLPKHLECTANSLANYAKSRALYIFGANHIAGTFLDLIGDASAHIRAVIDDDPKKKNHTIGISDLLIKSLDAINQNQPAHVLVAVNEGRSERLYKRLKAYLSENDGHRVESLASFIQSNWDSIK